MTLITRAYLRASSADQDSQRAKADLVAFGAEHGLNIVTFYSENESGASLARPELFKLLDNCNPGEVLLVEQVDRLSRLTGSDWDVLKAKIKEKRVRVVALDLPTSWRLTAVAGDDLTQRMMEALNDMMLDMLAAIARKDYEDRRRRTTQGIVKAKAIKGKYSGRPVDQERHQTILALLDKGVSWSDVCKATGASRSTLARVVKAAAGA